MLRFQDARDSADSWRSCILPSEEEKRKKEQSILISSAVTAELVIMSIVCNPPFLLLCAGLHQFDGSYQREGHTVKVNELLFFLPCFSS